MYNPEILRNRARKAVRMSEMPEVTTVRTPKQVAKKEENGFVRFFSTVGNIVNNVVMGAVKSLEGIVDAGAMLGGLFGADVDDFVSYDFTADIFGADEEGEGLLDWSWSRNLSEISYLDNDHIVNQIADGIGGMLPTVALAMASGGTSLAGSAAAAGAKAASVGAKVANVASKVGFVAGAAGNASESAFKEGATYEQALGYGALSGVTEGAIESISGGIAGTKMGTVLGKQVAKKTGTKLATTFVSEGLEEVASDLIDPVYQRITGVNKDAQVDANNLFKTFVIGGSVGAIMGGAGRKLKAHQNADNGGEKFLKVADEVSEIEDAITEKENVLSSEKKTQEDVDRVGVKVVDKIINSVKTISDHLQSMTVSQRSNALKIINGEESIISNLFESNGEVKAGVLEDLELSKKRNYSANAILKSQEIKDELANLNQRNGWKLQVDDSQVAEQERKKLAQFYAVRNGLTEKSGENLKFVVVKGEGSNNLEGFYSPNGKTIYISRETLSDSLKEASSNALYQTTVHETEHFVDNAPLQKYLINYAQKDEKLFDETVSELMKKGYGITRFDVENAIRKKTIGLDLSKREEIAYSELSANLAAKLLGNEDFVKRLSRTNQGLFNRIKNFISDKINSGKMSEAYRVAQHIFENALKEIKEKNTEKAEQIDISNGLMYSKKGYAKKQFVFQYDNFPPNNETHNTAHQDALHWARLDAVEVGDQRLIYSNSYWYVVEKFSDFLNNYQVAERISNTTFDKIYKEIKENGRSGRIKSISTSTDFIDKLNQPSYSLKTRKSSVDSVEIRHGKEDNQVQRLDKNQVERGERTGSNGARDSSSGSSNKQGTKFSLKDSDELRFSYKGKRTTSYINRRLDTPTLSFIRNELRKIYGSIDSGVADSLPIERNNQVYIVDSGLEDGRIDFGVKSVKTITDSDLRKEYIRRKNDEAIRKGHISYELSSRFGDEYVNSWNSYRRLKFRKELSNNTRKSDNNESGIFGKDAIDGRGRLNFSLKDSDELRFSYKGKRATSYINRRLDTPSLSFIRNELRKIYGPIDSAIADGIAIEKDNIIFVVDSGIEDGRVEFGVREKIKISDENLRKVKLEKINDRAISKGYVSIEIFRRIKHSSNNGSYGSIGRELSKELSDNTRKSDNNESRIFGKDATDGSGRLKFSLKDSEISDIKFSLREELELFHEIEIENENEYRRLEKEIKRRNGNHPAEFEWATTDRYLYIVRNNTLDSFSPILRIDCIKHEKLFMRLIRMIDLNNYSSEQTIRNWLDELYSHPDFFEWINLDLSSSVKSELAVTSDEKNYAVYNKFDSKGTELTDYQIDFFSESHARDRYGRLRVLYHGTLNEFFVFDKTLLGKNFRYNKDAKLGFFFTASYPLAGDYSVHAKEQQRYRILEETAHGDEKLLNFLLDKGNFESYDKVKKYLDKKTYDEIKEIDRKLENDENEIVSVYLNIKNPYIENWDRQAHYTTNVIRAIQKAKANNHDGVIIKRIDASVNQARPAADLYIVFEPNQIKLTSNKKPTNSPDIRFSKKITADMTDSERYEVLRNKKIENIPVAKELTKEQLDNIQSITSFEDLNKYFGAEKRNIIKKIASEFGVFKEYYNKDIELEFVFSKSNFNESYQKQKHDFVSYAKMFSVFDDVVEKAVGIEIHNRNLQGYKVDPSLKNVYVLASAFFDAQNIIPVKLEIKEFNDKNNKLYIAIALDKIKKTEVLEDRDDLNKEVAHSSLSVNISIRDLLKNVNPNDKDFYKYIPKQFFDKDLNIIKSLSKDKATYTLSDGQVKKKVANFTKLKVYSKVEAESIINSILETNFNIDDYSVRISGKTKAEAIDVLWKTLNTADAGKRTGLSLKIADYILDNSIMQNIYNDESLKIYFDTIFFLKPYLHSVDLKALKNDISDNSIYLLWGKRKGEDGQTADQIAMELAESGFFIDAENEADILFEMDRAYREAVRALKKKSDKFLADTLGKDERNKLRQDIAKDILRAFDSNGKKSKLAEIIEQQTQRAKVWKDLYYEEKARNKAIDNLLGKVETLKGLKEFENSTQYSSEQFKGSIEKLEKLKWRGKLNESGARKIVGVLNAWYNKDNAIVEARFDSEVSEDLNRIAGGNGKLTSTEINDLANVVDYFIHFIEHSRQVWENNRWIPQGPLAKEYYEKALENAKLKIGAVSRLMDSKYMETFADPMSIARNADRYSDGFFTKTMEDLRNGAVDSEIKAMEIASPIVDFLDRNKKYLKRVNKTTITYRGVEIPIIKAIDLYCELNRDQAILGFVKSGIKLTDVKGKKTITIGGIESNDELSFDEYKAIAQKEQAEIGKLLNDTDFEFIDILEKIYNKDCKGLKKERDMQLRGYTNIGDGYYYPTSRADTRKSINVDFFGGDRVGNESFNKSTVKGAQQTLWIESALDRALRHIEGVSRYYYLSNPIRNFEVLFNLDLGGNPNAPKSIKTATENTWRNGSEYLRKLMQDIQGIKNGDGSFVFGFLRKGFAKFQLGLNPKVPLSQFSSLFAAWNILDYGCIVKGFSKKVKTDDVDKYCSLAKLRNNDNTAVKSLGLLDNVDSFTDIFTVLIGKMDRRVVRILFGACQVQVKKNTGLKIGTEENKVKAGELLRKVILETQQNAIATERSKAMRSSSEFLKSTTMFTADIMKVTARVIDSFGEISTIKARLKIENDPVKREKLMESFKLAHKKARKSITAMVVQAVYMAILARLFDKFYNRDEDDEEVVTDLVVDFFGNMIGGLPLIKDLYSKVFEGYDFDSFAFSSMNDLFEAVGSVDGLWSGDSRQVAKTIRKISYAVGQIFGVPVRNLYNVFYGTSNLISPEFAYKLDDAFYKQSYNSDLKKAIKNNDEAMIATIAGLIMNENVGDFENGSTRSEVNRLLSAGFDVLPQSVPNSVTINEVQHSLAGPQQEKFRKAYSGAITAVDKLVSSNGYKIATDEAKAKAIKYVYRYYYYEAQHQALNVDLDSKLYLFGQIVPIEKMALALAEVPLLVENSTNKKTAVQRYLQASKLTSAQKYMLMGYFGYKNTKGEGVVKSAINKTSLTKEQKKLLLEKCGY